MDKNEFEERRQRRRERWERRGRYRNEKGGVWGGLFMLIVGAVLLLKVSGAVLFPHWFFTWPMILIVIGLFSGVKHRFRGPGWLIPLAVGFIFLTNEFNPSVEPYLWPVLLIGAGLFIIFRPKNRRCRRGEGPDDNDSSNERNLAISNPIAPYETNPNESDWTNATADRNDTLDATAVFGGVKKNVLSKNFKGGDITTFMGGAEINLTQADFTGRAVLDCFNMFGGTKLIIPPDWEVQSDMMAIFGGIDDKRPPAANGSNGKVLYLDGTCLFGGLEIKSY